MQRAELGQGAKVAIAQVPHANDDLDIEEREAIARRIPMRYHNFD
jgi:hypothetical protein